MAIDQYPVLAPRGSPAGNRERRQQLSPAEISKFDADEASVVAETPIS
jgi:hypothetical protein